MSVPERLSRPLAARVAALPDPVEDDDNPALPQAVIDAALEALQAGKTHYTDRPGILGLREWISKHLGASYGVELSADEVTITCGATEARFVALKQLVKQGKQILCVGDRTTITGAAHLIGAPIVNAASNPTAIGVLYCTPQDDMKSLQPALEHAVQHGWWVIWDVSDNNVRARHVLPLQQGANFHPAQNAALTTQVLTVGSLSHAMPGWRVGWMAGSKMANKLRAYKQSMTICTTSISQWAGLGLAK
jgi:arginine:pyruvate transaminase